MCPETYCRPIAVELSPGVSSFCSLFHLQLLLHMCPRTTPVLLYICVLRPIAAELSPGVCSFCSLFHLQLLPHIFHPQLLLLIHLQLLLHMCPRTDTIYVSYYYIYILVLLLYMCPQTCCCRAPASLYMCPRLPLYMCATAICVLVLLLYMCPQSSDLLLSSSRMPIYVSSYYYYICVLSPQTSCCRAPACRQKLRLLPLALLARHARCVRW